MVSALEAPDTRGRRKTQASKSTWKSYKDCYVCMLGEKKEQKHLDSYRYIRILWLRSVSPILTPRICSRDLYEICLGTTCEWQNLYLWGVMRKKQTSSHGGCRSAHRTWQCSHKNLGKVEREMVRETHKTVRGCCKSDLIFNLRFDKYQKRENFNVFRQMSWTGGFDLAGEW